MWCGDGHVRLSPSDSCIIKATFVCVCFLDIWTCWLESCQSGERVKAPRGRKSSVTSKFFNSLPGAFSFPLALSHIVRSTDIESFPDMLPFCQSQTLHPQSTLGLCGPSLQFNNSIILSHRTTCDIKAWIPSRCAFVFNPFSLICGCYHLFNSVFTVDDWKKWKQPVMYTCGWWLTITFLLVKFFWVYIVGLNISISEVFQFIQQINLILQLNAA